VNIFKLPVDGKGVDSDVARSSNDWHEFREYHKEHNPIRYFINNDFEAIFIWPWSMRLRRLTDWVRYRTTRRYHVIKTGMKPGYSDVSEKMLHVNFNMLKDFIEVEKAYMWTWHEKGTNNKSEQPGVSHLLWEMGLDNDDSWKGNKTQASNAREQYELYDWWTNQRPYRVDDALEEWEAYHTLKKDIYGDDANNFFRDDLDTPELEKLQKKWLTKSSKIEKHNLEEDEKNLIRLIKIRNSLWT
jgi:hypothetical protein